MLNSIYLNLISRLIARPNLEIGSRDSREGVEELSTLVLLRVATTYFFLLYKVSSFLLLFLVNTFYF
jgi:hypothetical protein